MIEYTNDNTVIYKEVALFYKVKKIALYGFLKLHIIF